MARPLRARSRLTADVTVGYVRRLDTPFAKELHMLFLVYWELNEATPAAQRLEASQKLQSSGLFPPKNAKVIRWDATPDLWGVLTLDAEDTADVFRAVNVWRVAVPGFFKTLRVSPALPVAETMPLLAETVKAVNA